MAHRQRDAQRGEPADERIVVPAAGEVDREHRVPGDERRRERRPCRCAGDRRGGDEHGGRREPLEEPGRGVGRGAGEERHGLREQGEHRAVDRRRVAPVGADVVGRGALREVRRGIDVRVAAAVARDPAVAPVRPRVGREEQRRRERDELDRRAEREHDADRCAPAHRDEAGEVRDERADQQEEERPRRPLGRVGAVGRHDGRVVPPRRGRRDGDEDERRRAAQHDGGPHGSRPGAYRSSLEPGPPARRSRGRLPGRLLLLLRLGRRGRRVVRVVAERRRASLPGRERRGPRGLAEVPHGRVRERRLHEAPPDLGRERAAGDGDPVDVRHRHLAARVAHPDGGRDPRRVPDEPRVGVLVRRPRLPGDRPGERRAGACPVAHVLLEHVGDGGGDPVRERRACGAARSPTDRPACRG